MEQLMAIGVVADAADVNWSIRLSERLPEGAAAVEIAVADTQLDVKTAATVAVLCRALVQRSLRDAKLGVVEPRPAHEVVRAACWHAAVHGVSGDLVDLGPAGVGSPRLRRAEEVLAEALTYVEPSLNGETEELESRLGAVLAGGSGADRQRRAWSEEGLAGILRLLHLPTPSLS